MKNLRIKQSKQVILGTAVLLVMYLIVYCLIKVLTALGEPWVRSILILLFIIWFILSNYNEYNKHVRNNRIERRNNVKH